MMDCEKKILSFKIKGIFSNLTFRHLLIQIVSIRSLKRKYFSPPNTTMKMLYLMSCPSEPSLRSLTVLLNERLIMWVGFQNNLLNVLKHYKVLLNVLYTYIYLYTCIYIYFLLSFYIFWTINSLLFQAFLKR